MLLSQPNLANQIIGPPKIELLLFSHQPSRISQNKKDFLSTNIANTTVACCSGNISTFLPFLSGAIRSIHVIWTHVMIYDSKGVILVHDCIIFKHFPKFDITEFPSLHNIRYNPVFLSILFRRYQALSASQPSDHSMLEDGELRAS